MEVFINGTTILENYMIYDLKLFNKYAPKIKFNKQNNKKYTIMMIDRDAIQKYWLHWLIVDTNNTIVPYNPPTPPKGSGTHHYCIIVLEQPNNIHLTEIPNRPNFNPKRFIIRHTLKCIHSIEFLVNN
jgi:phosphatidylethanolamine-binding protein (PEBP) family uncharacterized protein